MVTQLQAVKPLNLSRCYYAGMEGEVIASELHGFCDASAKAYGAVVFLRIVTMCASYVRFVSSKNRTETSLGADHTVSRTVISGCPVHTDP